MKKTLTLVGLQNNLLVIRNTSFSEKYLNFEIPNGYFLSVYLKEMENDSLEELNIFEKQIPVMNNCLEGIEKQ